MGMRVVLDFSDELYDRILAQIAIKKPEYLKGFIFDTLNKSLNNTEARQRKTASKK
jgi:hypothetical protein